MTRPTGAAEARPRVASRPRVSPGPTRRDARDFAQQRAQRTHDRLLAAAAQVFAERGFDATQTPQIAERAGVAVGSFYRYFSDKRQIFLELVRAHLDESFGRVMQRLTLDAFGGTRTRLEQRAAIEQVIEVLFETSALNPPLHRVFLAVSMRDEEVARIRSEYEDQSRAALTALIAQIVPSSRVPDPRAAAAVIQVAAQEVALTTAGLHGNPVTSADQAQALRAALSDMLFRYVFGEV